MSAGDALRSMHGPVILARLARVAWLAVSLLCLAVFAATSAMAQTVACTDGWALVGDGFTAYHPGVNGSTWCVSEQARLSAQGSYIVANCTATDTQASYDLMQDGVLLASRVFERQPAGCSVGGGTTGGGSTGSSVTLNVSAIPLLSMTAEDGVAISWAVISVWLAAWGFRQIVRLLNGMIARVDSDE